jgi:demethylmenaquinone methyltransferase/2-methoxy-6-polyprenyl-1,4-benzoquinol methylase
VSNRHENQTQIVDLYRKRAKGYDSSGIASLESWRKEAVKRLNLARGDLVVDIGCGTGLNFALLHEAIGAEGKIIGVDLTDAMLDQARQRAVEHGWKNVELVQSDAAQYQFPAQVDGIISTFALTFVPDSARVIQNGCKALAPGRKWVVLDMAWPQGWPLWWRRLLFFLPSYGITADVIQRQPWKTVYQTMQQCLDDVEQQQFWIGFFYLASGKQPAQSTSDAPVL